jgi:hypothetical protein
MSTLPASLPEGWFPSDLEKAGLLHAELQKELPPGHILYGVPVEVVAHRDGTDDILCRHRADPARFTVIHLSWLGREEINPQHPHVEDDGDFDSFLRYEAAFYGR